MQTTQAQNGPSGPQPALTGFDGGSNGFDTDNNQRAQDLAAFQDHETQPDGLGPIYDADSCISCHQAPIPGGSSQVTNLRAGHLDGNGNFVEAVGGSLIAAIALPGVPLPYVQDQETIRTLRISPNLLGDGYVESIADATLQAIAQAQPGQSNGQIQGEAITVPVLEQPGATGVGRFGWKDEQASLLSFCAEAALEEMGLTNPLFPTERTSLGTNVASFDGGASPNVQLTYINGFARLVRDSKAPPVDPAASATQQAQQGSTVFTNIGCAICHVSSITTAQAGTAVEGGAFTVPAALGNRVLHPFSDFLLHNVGTGDGIVQGAGPETANKIRTAPLWGLRIRNRMMHDGASVTLNDAILRHAGEASGVIANYQQLSANDQAALIAFLRSL